MLKDGGWPTVKSLEPSGKKRTGKWPLDSESGGCHGGGQPGVTEEGAGGDGGGW